MNPHNKDKFEVCMEKIGLSYEEADFFFKLYMETKDIKLLSKVKEEIQKRKSLLIQMMNWEEEQFLEIPEEIKGEEIEEEFKNHLQHRKQYVQDCLEGTYKMEELINAFIEDIAKL